MLDTIATVVVVVLGIHIIVKFAFFALPYRRRRPLLDQQYGDKPSATTTSDLATMAFTVLVEIQLNQRRTNPQSTQEADRLDTAPQQHRGDQFHRPVSAARAAAPPSSPLKEMSYAIQDGPWRPWPQLLALTGLVVFRFVLMW
ncbi:hypothetical protein OK015_16060 [Mycobacterium sp. Aquia_216]|uniref:hypothetical protein n=1 Tax=Mycobacterium sp. Aquia_216 TaxID=2991729 RepID=UPI00227C5F5F|nr:hypothetical protein [Mycobacterium sp. Aquia_216]WAJ42780.1 hypothetical protein OK015_16060 [Mycobacterium sp. Aquia_216]